MLIRLNIRATAQIYFVRLLCMILMRTDILKNWYYRKMNHLIIYIVHTEIPEEQSNQKVMGMNVPLLTDK